MGRRVVGLDGCRSGWVAVTLLDGRLHDVRVVAEAAHVLAGAPSVLAVDIPIGLVDGPRDADTAARAALPGRAASVFSAPARSVVEGHRDGSLREHAEATARSVVTAGSGLSMQSWRLVPKVAEVDALHAAHPAEPLLLEVHPEVAFTTLLGEVPPRKASWPGIAVRRRALADRGLILPDRFPGDHEAAPDDVVDAAMCAWVADGAALGEELVTLPPATVQHDRGRPIVIVARRPLPGTPSLPSGA